MVGVEPSESVVMFLVVMLVVESGKVRLVVVGCDTPVLRRGNVENEKCKTSPDMDRLR